MISIHYFDKANLISFGNYLLSDERRALVEGTPNTDPENLETKLSEVSDADVRNWFEQQPVKLSGA